MKPRMVLVWSGAVNPNYQSFFIALGEKVDLHVISPRSGKHGSVFFEVGKPFDPPVVHTASVHFHFLTFLRLRSSFYCVPAWPKLILQLRPEVLYWMDEADRWSTCIHLGLGKLLLPQLRMTLYLLQNLVKPSYYRFHHDLAWKWNQRLVHQFAAATPEAHHVARSHGMTTPSAVIPLCVDELVFRPPTADEKVSARLALGLSPTDRVLAYAGTLHPAKGIERGVRIAAEFPSVHYIIASGETWPEKASARPFRVLKDLRGSQLLRLYHAADAVLLASESTSAWKEQMGRILIEGCFSGCLALGSDSGSIPEVVGDAKLLFHSGSDDSLRDLLRRWTQGELDSLQPLQYQRMREKFSTPVVAEATLRFIFPELY